MGFFNKQPPAPPPPPPEPDAITLIKKDIEACIKLGDIDGLKRTLEGKQELPAPFLKPFLEETIRNDQVRMSGVLLAHGARPLDMNGVLRKALDSENKEMFALLDQHGTDFVKVISATSGDSDAASRVRIRLLRQQLKCDRLLTEIRQLKGELTTPANDTVANETAVNAFQAKDTGLRL